MGMGIGMAYSRQGAGQGVGQKTLTGIEKGQHAQGWADGRRR
jgi:hypothetical protein